MAERGETTRYQVRTMQQELLTGQVLEEISTTGDSQFFGPLFKELEDLISTPINGFDDPRVSKIISSANIFSEAFGVNMGQEVFIQWRAAQIAKAQIQTKWLPDKLVNV